MRRKKTASQETLKEAGYASWGKDILPLVEFPLALLSPWKRQPRRKTIEFVDQTTTEDGKVLTRRWVVMGSEELGLPVATDEDVFVVLLEVAREQGFSSRDVFFTQSDLIRRMRWPHKGESMEKLKRALTRLMSTTIICENVIWDKDKQEFLDTAFHIIDRFQLYRMTAGGKRQVELSFATWSDVVWRLIVQGQLKNLDTHFYFSLERPTSKRLFRFLDKRFMDGKKVFAIELSRLAFSHLGLTGIPSYPSKIKEKLTPAHEELLDRGYLRKVDYVERKGVWVVKYYPSEQARERAVESAKAEGSEGKGLEEEIVGRLVSLGVTRSVAEQLVLQFGADVVKRQLEYLPFRRPRRNLPGLLVTAIKENWPPPPSWEKATKGRARPPKGEGREDDLQERIREIRASLSKEELQRLRQEALRRLPRGLREKALKSKGGLAHILEAMVDNIIKERFL